MDEQGEITEKEGSKFLEFMDSEQISESNSPICQFDERICDNRDWLNNATLSYFVKMMLKYGLLI